ncbi:sensor domain-containing diguanylate cyclase [Actimicrobium antarcticum]|uniref:GGDEF domain-containing protein n=1 Tax=Actimicrobium antarcticum TaxID=1051899 RepID=A0ABP7TTM6_9BURK
MTSKDFRRFRIAPPSGRAIFQYSWMTIMAWPIACMLLAAVVWMLILGIIRTDRTFLDSSARKDASYIATSYAQHLTRSFKQADQVASHLRFDWEQPNHNRQSGLLSDDSLIQSHGLLHAAVIDSDSNVISATRSEAIGAHVAEMDFFKVHRTADTDQAYISQPVTSALSGKPAIHLTRRLRDANGRFNGVVVVWADPAYFSTFFDRTGSGEVDFLAFMGKDGIVRSSRIGNIVYPANSPAIRKIPQMVPAQRGVAKIDDASTFADGEVRYVAWQSLADYPFVTLVGISETRLLASHAESWETYRQGATGITLFLALLSLVGMLMSIRLSMRQYQAEDIKRTYRMATEGGNEGFYMLRALTDSHQNTVDFLIEDCNERGALLIGAKRDELIGAAFSDYYNGIQKKIILDIFRKAMLSGFHEDEFEVGDESPLRGTWMHRRLVRSGSGLAMTLRDISVAKNYQAELARVANEDTLTALPSRHWLTGYLPDALERNAQAGTMVAMLFVDLDGFKNVNDTLGHAAGDELLQQAAKRLQSVLRPGDHVVRLGGDEFTTILESIMCEADATRVAVRIVEAFNKPFELSRGVKTVGTSVGISLFPRDGTKPEALLMNADTAMYRAKSEGKNQYRVYRQPTEHSES